MHTAVAVRGVLVGRDGAPRRAQPAPLRRPPRTARASHATPPCSAEHELLSAARAQLRPYCSKSGMRVEVRCWNMPSNASEGMGGDVADTYPTFHSCESG